MTEEERKQAHREADRRWKEKRLRENPFKKCTRCGEIKPIDEFSFIYSGPGTNRKFGSKCVKCRHEKRAETKEQDRARAEQYYKDNRQLILESSKLRRKNNIEKSLLKSALIRAKKKGLDFNIDETDIVIPQKCPVLGIPLKLGEGRPISNSPTLDRIEPSKGYVKGNVMVISYKANTIKSDAGPQELMQVAIFYNNLSKLKLEGKI